MNMVTNSQGEVDSEVKLGGSVVGGCSSIDRFFGSDSLVEQVFEMDDVKTIF